MREERNIQHATKEDYNTKSPRSERHSLGIILLQTALAAVADYWIFSSALTAGVISTSCAGSKYARPAAAG